MEYLIIVILAIVYALIRAKHDSYINEGLWKNWAVVEAVFFTGIITWLVGTNIADYIMLPIIFGIWWSIIFDSACGWFRAKKLLYFGSGAWDSKIKRIFQYPGLYLAFKVIWLIITTGAYFGWIKEYF